MARDVRARLYRDHEIERDEVQRVTIDPELLRGRAAMPAHAGDPIRELAQLRRQQITVHHLQPPVCHPPQEGIAHPRDQLIIGPLCSESGRDHRSHARSAQMVEWNPGLDQCFDHADMRVAARSAAGQNQPDRATGYKSRKAPHIVHFVRAKMVVRFENIALQGKLFAQIARPGVSMKEQKLWKKLAGQLALPSGQLVVFDSAMEHAKTNNKSTLKLAPGKYAVDEYDEDGERSLWIVRLTPLAKS